MKLKYKNYKKYIKKYKIAKIFKVPKTRKSFLINDGLAILRNSSGPNTDRIKKRIIKLFQKHNLKITNEANIIQTDFLDVTLNLNTEKHWPFRKPNDEQLHININSNHALSIKKPLPNMISNRLSELSCDLDNFKKAIPPYKNAIKQSGYKDNLIFSETQPKNKSRKRKIIWFNRPFNNYVANNIGKEFLKLISKHFPLKHKLHKILNINSIKISYSCMPNMKTIITGTTRNYWKRKALNNQNHATAKIKISAH